MPADFVMSAEGSTLALFAKRPQPGRVKTRLAAETSPTWAFAVAAAFLSDLVERYASFPARRVLVFAPKQAQSYFTILARNRYAVAAQSAGDLGARMQAFISGELNAVAGKVVLLGMDSPTLPLAMVEQAFQELDHADVVLGPAMDGGYYLVGCGPRLPPIFEGVDWSGPQVLAQTVARLPPSWRLALLLPWYDVDTLADWRMLTGHLAAMRRAGLDPGLPRTEAIARLP